jgi:methylenetetrahydrofolate reductase (NADPH)
MPSAPHAHDVDYPKIIALCPKHMLNGPCGGVRASGTCEVSESIICPYPSAANVLPWRLRTSAPQGRHNQLSAGTLAQKLRAGQFVTIAELWPPDTIDFGGHIARYAAFQDKIDAVNIASNPLATPHVNTLATAATFERHGFATIMNITCRDSNRIGLQADLLAAAALGVQNVFCITGDHPALGDHPHAKGVFDVDAFGLIALARRLRDTGQFESGRATHGKPNWLIGAAGNPFSHPQALQAERAAAKVFAGAEFIQTQAVFSAEAVRGFVNQLADFGALALAWLIVGVGVVTTLEQAVWLNGHVPGASVPDVFMERLRREPAHRRRHAGLTYAREVMAELREMRGVSGVLLFAMEDDVESLGELLCT